MDCGEGGTSLKEGRFLKARKTYEKSLVPGLTNTMGVF